MTDWPLFYLKPSTDLVNLQLMADKPMNMVTRYMYFTDDIIPVWTVCGVVMGRRGWCEL